MELTTVAKKQQNKTTKSVLISKAILTLDKRITGASLVVQWLRIRLPMQGYTGSSPRPGGSPVPRSN